MTIETYDAKFTVASTMVWHSYPEDPISEMSGDTYLYFAFANSNGAFVRGNYLGNELSAVDDYGNAILTDTDIYAWSESTIEAPNLQGFKDSMQRLEASGQELIYGIFNESETDIPFYSIKIDRQKTSVIYYGTYKECQDWLSNN